MLTEAKAKRIQVFGFGYNGDTDSLRKALDNLKRSGARYIFGIPEPGEYDFLVREIYSADLMNTENVWIFADSASPLTSRELFFEDQDMANAVQGVGVLLADPPLNPKLVDSFAEFRSEPGMLQGFYDIHVSFIHYANMNFHGILTHQIDWFAARMSQFTKVSIYHLKIPQWFNFHIFIMIP